MILKIKLLNENSIAPTKGSIDAAAYDLYANLKFKPDVEVYNKYNHRVILSVINDSITIEAGDSAIINMGIAVEIENGYYMEIVPRSGTSTKEHKFLANSPGIIDSDYRGIVHSVIFNASDKPIIIKHGERLTQFQIHKIEPVNIDFVDELSETNRGEKGFGSTGKF
jgi:dUTP pyrophosphatase